MGLMETTKYSDAFAASASRPPEAPYQAPERIHGRERVRRREDPLQETILGVADQERGEAKASVGPPLDGKAGG